MPSDTENEREPEASTPAVGSSPAPETASQALRSDAETDTEGEREEVGQVKGRFDSSSASAAAKARWAKERERDTEAAEAASDGRVVMMRVPVHLGSIVSKLAEKAKKGDTHAARELREWMRQFPADDETDISALDARTQAAVLTRILAEIIEEEGSAPDAPEGGPVGVG